MRPRPPRSATSIPGVGGASSGRVVVTRHPGEHFDTGAPFQSDADGHDSGDKLQAFFSHLHTRQQLNIRS